MIENKWMNGGIAVVVAGALTGLAVWMSSEPPVEQSPKSDQPGLVDDGVPAAPADRAGRGEQSTVDRVENETQAAPPDMGGLKPPTKG